MNLITSYQYDNNYNTSNTNYSPAFTIFNTIHFINPKPLFNLYTLPNTTSPSTPSSSTNRAYRTLKRKFPNTPFPSNPGTSTSILNHPPHTNTKEFLQIRLPFFPQYTYFHSDPNEERPIYVNEHVVYPTLSRTSHYHLTNPLTLPLHNTPHNNELSSTLLYLLTTALTLSQFTQVGYQQSVNKFTAPKANTHSIDYYDHNIIRPNEDICLLGDPNTNPQLTEKFFTKTSYNFTLNMLDKKYDKVISAALRNTNAYESYFNKFNFFSLIFPFFTPTERNLHCSHEIMLRTKQTHTYTYYKFIESHYIHHTPARQLHHFFLISPIVLKTLAYKAPSKIMIPSPRCISSAH